MVGKEGCVWAAARRKTNLGAFEFGEVLIIDRSRKRIFERNRIDYTKIVIQSDKTIVEGSIVKRVETKAILCIRPLFA